MSTQHDIYAIRAERLANTHDPLKLMANTQMPFHPDHSSHITYIQHPKPTNFVSQPSFITNSKQQPMQNTKDTSDLTTAMNMALDRIAKALWLNKTIPTTNNQRCSSNPSITQISQQEITNQYGNGNVVTTPFDGNGDGINGNPKRCYNCRGEGHYASNCTIKSRKRDAAYLQQHLQITQEEEAGIQSTQEEFEFMTAADAHEETTRVKVKCTSEDTLQQASTSITQSNSAPVYDSDRSAKQCLVTANHDVCVLIYVHDMNSRADNQSSNVSIHENQKKHKANSNKSKELGSKESLPSSRPSKPRTCLKWIPTGTIFAMCGKLIASSNTENKSENLCVTMQVLLIPRNLQAKGFQILFLFLAGYQD
nr:hypothetical protein [Tanacetum cinerariifolium]